MLETTINAQQTPLVIKIIYETHLGGWGWDRGSRQRGHVHTCGCHLLVDGRHQYSPAKQ